MVTRKYKTQTSPRWAFMRWFDIPDANNLEVTYLRRLRIIQTPWFAFYLHFIYLPDRDRDPHDHPWNFWSLVLRGGYTERVHYSKIFLNSHTTSKRRRWSLHRMPVTMSHTITRLDPRTITLVLTGRRQRDWGFWTSDGWVHYQEYNDIKYGADELL